MLVIPTESDVYRAFTYMNEIRKLGHGLSSCCDAPKITANQRTACLVFVVLKKRNARCLAQPVHLLSLRTVRTMSMLTGLQGGFNSNMGLAPSSLTSARPGAPSQQTSM